MASSSGWLAARGRPHQRARGGWYPGHGAGRCQLLVSAGLLKPFRGFGEPGRDGGDLICGEALFDGRLECPGGRICSLEPP